MKVFTAHVHARRPPVLVPEAFSWGALFFGPLWLLPHGAWIAGALAAGAAVLACTRAAAGLRPPLALRLLLLLGLFGHDLRRWSLGCAGFRSPTWWPARTRTRRSSACCRTAPTWRAAA